jgi:hypothetical protein
MQVHVLIQRSFTGKVSDSLGSVRCQSTYNLPVWFVVCKLSLNYNLYKHMVVVPWWLWRKLMCSWFVLGRFCRSCIATSLRNNKWTCPYCRAYLPSEGVPATDVAKRMKSEYQTCTECDTLVCTLLRLVITNFRFPRKWSFHLRFWPQLAHLFEVFYPILSISISPVSYV